MRMCFRTSRCESLHASLQEVLGKHMIERQGLAKSFLTLRVEALRGADDAALGDLSRHLASHEIAAGTEFDVRLVVLAPAS
jgi:hypothetical protein